MDHRIFIGIGSNIGDSARCCEEAMQRVAALPDVASPRFSSLYVTSPVSGIPQNDFINAVMAFYWRLSPFHLLEILSALERDMGRERSLKDGPRTIDLDILLFGDLLLESPKLTIPHPRMHLRRFALVPCLEIDAGLRHPLYGLPLRDYLAAIPDSQQVALLRTFIGPRSG